MKNKIIPNTSMVHIIKTSYYSLFYILDDFRSFTFHKFNMQKLCYKNLRK